MKFYQGFLGLIAVGSALIYAAMNFAIHAIANTLMLAAGIALLALDAFAFLIWFVNWKYYPES
jgi:hypothetical protein